MATELAKAYVQIIPSAKNIKSQISAAITPGLSEAGDDAGGVLGNSLVGKLKGIISVAAIGKAITSSIMEGANLEQSIGGIDTLFKESYSKVEKYANKAYETAGLSANDYMQTVTSFSASLLKSLDGDTNKAADSANQALTDMSDNANKMGTSMELIQNAYQGFAKQNYTMLDNLKLGYGGTKEEMQRLLVDAQAISGVKYDISNLSDVYEAIHVIQTDLGITGTTALEASTTFTGSFNAMKGAVSNFLATLSLGDEATMTMQDSMSALVSSTATFLIGNALPMLANIVTTFPSAIFAALDSVSEMETGSYLESLFGYIEELLTDRIPSMTIQGFNLLGGLIGGLIEGLPNLLETSGSLIDSLSADIMESAPLMLDAAATLIIGLATGMIDNLPEILTAGAKLSANLLGMLLSYAPEFLEMGVSLIGKLAAGLLKATPSLIAKIPSIAVDIVGSFAGLPGQLLDVGVNLIKGLWNGIKSVKGWILSKIRGFGGSILNELKDFFDINSPSGLLEDEVGVFMAEGVGVGFVKRMKSVSDTMKESVPSKFNIEPTVSMNNAQLKAGISSEYNHSNSFDYEYLAEILVNALAGVQIKVSRTINGKDVAEEIFEPLNELMGLNMGMELRGV